MNGDVIDLSIVIPAYKEALKIETDIRGAAAFLRDYRLNGEIIVVDDGSPDDTARRARALGDEFPNLTVISYEPNRGKGHALRYGIMRTRGRNVLFADTGMCVPYNIASIGIEMLNLRMCDVAHGSRRMRGSVVRPQPLYRRIGSRVFKLVIHLFMGVPLYISDTQCGFKLYRKEVAHRLYGQAFTNRMMFDAEITLRAIREGFRILEFPVLWSNDPDTRFDPFKGSVTNFKELVRIRLAMLQRKPSISTPFDVRERSAADESHTIDDESRQLVSDGVTHLNSRTGARGTV